jgi:hypothetical protein
MDGHNPNASLLAEGGGRIVAMSGGGSIENALATSLSKSVSHLEGPIKTIQEAIAVIRRNEALEPLRPIHDGLVGAEEALTIAVRNPTRPSVEAVARTLDQLRRDSVTLQTSSPPSGDRRGLLERLFGAIAVAQKWGSDFLKGPEAGSTYVEPERASVLPEKEPVTSHTDAAKSVKIANGPYGIANSGSDPKGFQLEDLFTLKEPIAGTRARKPTYDLTKIPNDANQTLIGHLVNAIQDSTVSMKVTVTEPKK